MVDKADLKSAGGFSVEVQVLSRAPNGALVQLGERYPCKVEVVGSTPTRSTI